MEYGLSLNHWAGMNAKYESRFPKLHEGMVEIIEIPNYQLGVHDMVKTAALAAIGATVSFAVSWLLQRVVKPVF